MLFMQSELDVLPAFVGAGIYIAYRFVSSCLTQREKQRGEPAAKKLDVEFTDVNYEGSWHASCQPNPSEEVPEPAPEPLEETATEEAAATLPSSAGDAHSKQGFSLWHVLALVVMVITLCIIGTTYWRYWSLMLHGDHGKLKLPDYGMHGNSASSM